MPSETVVKQLGNVAISSHSFTHSFIVIIPVVECVCRTCTANFVLSKDYKKCIANTNCADCGQGIAIPNEAGTDCLCRCDIAFNEIGTAGSTCKNCLSVLPNCQSFELVGSTCECTACNEGFTATADKSSCLECAATITQCKICTETAGTVDACTQCNIDFGLSNPTTCTACLEGCQNCTITSTNVCIDCKAGYVLNSEGTCIQCPANCEYCGISPTDINVAYCFPFSCAAGHALSDSSMNCDECTAIPNCKICTKNALNEFECIQCAVAHFQESKSVCTACTAGCNFCVNSTTTCLQDGCKSGYIRNRILGSCVSCGNADIKNCAYASITTEFLEPKVCKLGYNTVTGPPISCQACSDGCDKCTTAGAGFCDADHCQEGYFRDSDNKCYKNNPSCLTSKRSGSTTVCDTCSAHKVFSVGSCLACPIGCNECIFVASTSTFQCTTCLEKFYLTDAKGCSECPIGCSQCNLNNGQVDCTVCDDKFVLKNAKCEVCGIGSCNKCKLNDKLSVTCDTCVEEYFLDKSECTICPSNCLACSYNDNTICTECEIGYLISEGKCEKCNTANCVKCSTSGTSNRCSACGEGYFLSEGICLICNFKFPNCNSCTGTTCNSCSFGYVLNNNDCSNTCSIAGCSTCSYGETCKTCKNGTFSHDFGRQCAVNCLSCSGTEEECGKEITDVTLFQKEACGIGHCWSFRTDTDSVLSYARGCRNQTCTSDTIYESCEGKDGMTTCSKCCEGENCNTFYLDGIAGGNVIFFNAYLFFACAFIKFLEI